MALRGSLEQQFLIIMGDRLAGIMRLAKEADAALKVGPQAEVLKDLPQHLDFGVDSTIAQAFALALLLKLGDVSDADIADQPIGKFGAQACDILLVMESGESAQVSFGCEPLVGRDLEQRHALGLFDAVDAHLQFPPALALGFPRDGLARGLG